MSKLCMDILKMELLPIWYQHNVTASNEIRVGNFRLAEMHDLNRPPKSYIKKMFIFLVQICMHMA